MTNKISNEMKDAVIRLYLQGTSRNDIAKTCGIGDGTVSNTIDE
jgi:transposase-like protein